MPKKIRSMIESTFIERYVLGFCFVPDGSCILMQRTKPDWQQGLVNGLGGSIERGEATEEAMRREFLEECGVATRTKQWRHGITITGDGYELNVLRCVLDWKPELASCDEGQVDYYQEPPENMEQTARWLYWMCRDNSTFGLLSNKQGLK